MRGNRFLIPEKLRKQILQLAQQGHQGMVRTKSRLREKVWWPVSQFLCNVSIPYFGRIRILIASLLGKKTGLYALTFHSVFSFRDKYGVMLLER